MSQGFPGSDPSKQSPFGAGGAGIPNPYGGAGGPGYGQGAGPAFGPSGVPPKPDRSGCIAASIVGGIVGLLLLVCGSCGGFGFFVLDAQFKETARQLSVDYRNDPKVKEEIGEIQEVTFNWGASLNEGEEPYTVYDVRGDKGTAQFVVEDDGEGGILSAQLKSNRGQWDLPTGGPDVEGLHAEP